MNKQLEALFAEYDALKVANAAVIEHVRKAAIADEQVSADVWASFEAYLAASRKLSKQLAVTTKAGV